MRKGKGFSKIFGTALVCLTIGGLLMAANAEAAIPTSNSPTEMPSSSEPYDLGSLSDDLKNLPEYQDGVSAKEEEAIEQICLLTKSNDPEVKKGLSLIEKYGVPKTTTFGNSEGIPNYNTQLEVLLWLAQNDTINKDYGRVVLGLSLDYGSIVTIGDEEVDVKVRDYVSQFYSYIKDTDKVLEQKDLSWRARDYPLEAIIGLVWGANNLRYPYFYEHEGDPQGKPWQHYWRNEFKDRQMNSEDFDWLFVSPDNLQEMSEWAFNEHLVYTDMGGTANRLDTKLGSCLYYMTDKPGEPPSYFEVEGKITPGCRISNPDWQWEYFKEKGKIVGNCEDVCFADSIFLRSLNIAAFGGHVNSEGFGHCVILYYAPQNHSLRTTTNQLDIIEGHAEGLITYRISKLPWDNFYDEGIYAFEVISSDKKLLETGIDIEEALSMQVNAAEFCVSNALELRGALDVAESNGQDDVIKIAQGMYNTGGNSFFYSGDDDYDITISGGWNSNFTTQELDATNTVLNNDAPPCSPGANVTYDNVLYIRNYGCGDIIIEGITMQNGRACLEVGKDDHIGGAGANVFSSTGNINFSHNRVIGNSIIGAGGEPGGTYDSILRGAGLHARTAGSVTVKDNIFSGNTISAASVHEGDNILGAGAAICTLGDGDIFLDNNVFSQNTLEESGTAHGNSICGAAASVWNAHSGNAYISGNIIIENAAIGSNAADVLRGAGLRVSIAGGSADVKNNIIASNYMVGNGGDDELLGGGIFWYFGFGEESNFINNTVAFNHVSGGAGSDEVLGGGVCIINYHITTFFFNNIVWGNTVDAETGLGEDIHNGFQCSASHICYNDYSSLSGEPPANTCPECDAPPYGNLNVDPLFVNPAEGDFHVQAGSPVIDMGTASAPGLPATDIEGNPRISGAAPDMGAYEQMAEGDILGYYRGLGLNPNVVETTDLLKAIGDWANGEIPPDLSQALTTTQLLQLIGEWAGGG